MQNPMTSNAVTVLKVGGANLNHSEDLGAVVDLVRGLRTAGRRAVVVHGGGTDISRLQDRFGLPTETIDGLRVTRGEAMDVTIMALCGVVQTRLVERLVAARVEALGVSGVDLGLLRAPLLDEDRLGRVGGAPIVDVERLGALLEVAPVLVIAPVSLGPDGRAVNVNADDAAHAIAAALGAESLDFVSDIPGVRDGDDRVAHRLAPAAAEALIESRVAHGGMVPKLRAAVSAIEAGVGRVRIGNLTTLRNDSATEISVAVGSSS